MPRILADSTHPGSYASLRRRFGRRYARARAAGRDAKSSWERARSTARSTWRAELVAQPDAGPIGTRFVALELEELGYQVAFQRGLKLDDAVLLLVSQCRLFQARSLLEAQAQARRPLAQRSVWHQAGGKLVLVGEALWCGLPTAAVDVAIKRALRDSFVAISPAERQASRVARGKAVARG